MRIRRILAALAALMILSFAQAEEIPADPMALAMLAQLPVLDIRTGGAEIDDETLIPATVTRYIWRHGAVAAESWQAEIRVRGNTSKQFPKKGYRLQLLDGRGGTADASLLPGLREDDDWILNPMYTDTSKIRETLAYRIWDMMNSSGQRAQSSRIAYAEVFLNGEYWGLYGVQERVDRKQVEASKRFDVLYKVATNTRPAVQELLNCLDPEICQCFEVVHAGSRVEDVWMAAASYIALLEGGENPGSAALSLENAIDYGLFAMLTQAHDCHFKNQYLNCVYTTSGYVMYKLPWDLNNTFGDIYQNDRGDINFTNFAVGDLVMDGVFELLAGSGDPAINASVARRWKQLRSTVITPEYLMRMANGIYDPLADAIWRDSLRWPESGMGEGNAVNIRDLEEYFSRIIPRIDAWVTALINTEGAN